MGMKTQMGFFGYTARGVGPLGLIYKGWVAMERIKKGALFA